MSVVVGAMLRATEPVIPKGVSRRKGVDTSGRESRGTPANEQYTSTHEDMNPLCRTLCSEPSAQDDR
eukprot:12364958-Prorocentrum_lima.AAC.1